jgi:hypothetical protein
MSQSFAEVLLLIPTTLSAGLCMFVAGVIQNVMNEMDALTFKHFLTRLFRNALKSPFNLTTSLLTTIGAVPYVIAYGFGHVWFTAGIAFFVLASTASKIFNVPIYRRVMTPGYDDPAALTEDRRKLQQANVIRATLSFASVILMALQLADQPWSSPSQFGSGAGPIATPQLNAWIPLKPAILRLPTNG